MTSRDGESRVLETDNPDAFLALHELVRAARTRLSRAHWDYLMGGSDTETTLRRNRQALDSIALRPRVLRDVHGVDCGGTLLGHRLRLPAILAPIGSMQDFVAGGGTVPARAAAEFGTNSTLSSACQPELEAVAAAAEGPKIYQLYVRGDAAWVDDHLRRAIDAGYTAFCFTVDLDYYARRERDIAKRHVTTSRQYALGDAFQERFCWADIARIRDRFDIPLILKGIATAEDATLAVEHGIAGIWVSNHGGRQLDHAQGGIDTLPDIVRAVAGRAQIIFDGGIMRGTDLVKAMALGADAVAIGRLQGLAAAAAGQAGIVRALELLESETCIVLGLMGAASFAGIDASRLCPATPTAPAHVLSAFPLLEEEGY